MTYTVEKIGGTSMSAFDAVLDNIFLRPKNPYNRVFVDLSTLKLESGSFLEDDLRPYYSDVLYSMKTECGYY